MKRALAWIGFLLSISAYSQEAGETIPRLLDSAQWYQFGNYNKTLGFLNEAEKLIQTKGAKNSVAFLVRAYQIRIMANRVFSHPSLTRQALVQMEKTVSESKNELGPTYEESRRDVASLWAQFYTDIDDYERALGLFNESLTEFEKLPQTNKNCRDLYMISEYIAGIENIKGEWEASINQHLASVAYYKCFTKSGTDYALQFRNIGSVYLTKGDYMNARAYLDRAQDSLAVFWKKSKEKSRPAAQAFVLIETLANYYRHVKQYDSALITIQGAAYYLPYSEPFRGRYFLALGEAYESLGNFQLAKEFYQKAIEFFIKSSGEKSVLLSNAFVAAARLAEKQTRFDEAVNYCQNGIASLALDFTPKSLENPPLTNILSKKRLFEALQLKSHLLKRLYGKKNDETLLKQAWQVNQLSMALIDSTANEFTLDKDKIILAGQSYSAYEDGIRIAYQLFQQTGDAQYFTNCFSLVDKSKGIVLLENLRLVNRFAGLSQEWLDKEKDLKSELLFSEQAVYESELSKRSVDELTAVREHYASAKLEYAALISQIKKEAPDYYRLRFDRGVITPDIIQSKMLKNEEAIIEYFVGDSSLAVFGFSKDHRYGNVKKIMTDFPEKIAKLRSLLTETEELAPSEELQNSSSELYDFLIKDCLKELGPGLTSIIIIPDGVLGYIPFEILLKKSNEPDPPYLGNEYSIHYANSASYLKEQQEKKSSPAKYFFAGFVSSEAIQSGNQATAALPGTKKEVAAIAELIGSDLSIFNPASKSDFKTYAQDYKIIHLAMHSLLNDENPMLSVMVFSPIAGDLLQENRLSAIELYSMQLKSELAVLSACNTGIGQVHRGEGILSFARAFAYAGVPSAVISLWQVPDKATSRIMVNFYKYLKQGQSKDRALQMAKKDFIRDYPQMAHPYYWSGFILTGNNEPIEFPASRSWVWGIIISLIAFSIALVKRKMIHETWLKINRSREQW